MKKVWFVLLAIALIAGACGVKNELEVREPWMRAAAQGGNTGMYMLLVNSTAQDDELVGASSDVSEVVEIHISRNVGGVMEMIKQESVPLPAGEEVAFVRGGLHIMFIRLKQDLKAGDEVQVTLHFKNQADIRLNVPVKEVVLTPTP